jgi:RimJ/RimL family protein N-acetyltransferase
LSGGVEFPLQTERLLIRQMRREDAEALYEMDADPATWEFIGVQPPVSLAWTRERIQRQARHHEVHGFAMWTVIERVHGRAVGECGLQLLEEGPEVELGYKLVGSARGRGIATEAAGACLEAGFEQLGLERIVAVAWPDNVASRRVMEKVGMTPVGPGHHYGHETVLYAISRAAPRRRQ